MSSPRYSVWNNVNSAIEYGPEYGTWPAAKQEITAWSLDRCYNKRIWDHSTTPPTDVTDADPEQETKEAVWWSCFWEHGKSLEVSRTDNPMPRWIAFRWSPDDNGFDRVRIELKQPDAPTLEQIREVVERITGVDIPEPEAPRWWEWVQHVIGDPIPGHWEEYYDQNRKYTSAIAQGAVNDVRCIVYGTTETRDAKRDALLEAARAAGKPEVQG